jgi:hypothetical protein
MSLRRLASTLVFALVTGAPLVAQTPAQNDSAVKAAAKTNGCR